MFFPLFPTTARVFNRWRGFRPGNPASGFMPWQRLFPGNIFDFFLVFNPHQQMKVVRHHHPCEGIRHRVNIFFIQTEKMLVIGILPEYLFTVYPAVVDVVVVTVFYGFEGLGHIENTSFIKPDKFFGLNSSIFITYLFFQFSLFFLF